MTAFSTLGAALAALSALCYAFASFAVTNDARQWRKRRFASFSRINRHFGSFAASDLIFCSANWRRIERSRIVPTWSQSYTCLAQPPTKAHVGTAFDRPRAYRPHAAP